MVICYSEERSCYCVAKYNSLSTMERHVWNSCINIGFDEKLVEKVLIANNGRFAITAAYLN